MLRVRRPAEAEKARSSWLGTTPAVRSDVIANHADARKTSRLWLSLESDGSSNISCCVPSQPEVSPPKAKNGDVSVAWSAKNWPPTI